MAQNKNNNKNGGDCCSFCGAKRTERGDHVPGFGRREYL